MKQPSDYFSLQCGLAWTYESNALNFDMTKPPYLAPIFGAGGLGHELHSPHDFSPMLGFAWNSNIFGSGGPRAFQLGARFTL